MAEQAEPAALVLSASVFCIRKVPGGVFGSKPPFSTNVQGDDPLAGIALPAKGIPVVQLSVIVVKGTGRARS